MKENFTSGIDEGRQDKLGEACFLLYFDNVDCLQLEINAAHSGGACRSAAARGKQKAAG